MLPPSVSSSVRQSCLFPCCPPSLLALMLLLPPIPQCSEPRGWGWGTECYKVSHSAHFLAVGFCICSIQNILKEKTFKDFIFLKEKEENLFLDTSNNNFELLGFDTFVSNYIVANNGAPVSQYLYRGILIGLMGMEGKEANAETIQLIMLKTMLTLFF